MTSAEIEAFLAVCRWKTITGAAQKLYINQSSLSIRLKTLENEIGGPLFVRQKGLREIALTPAGETFYQLALQYEDITKKMLSVYSQPRQTLHVASINSLGAHLLPQVYELFMQKYPEIELVVQDMETDAADRSILQGKTDLAFTTSSESTHPLSVVPIFSEEMVFVCSADSHYPDYVTQDILDLKREVYAEWCAALTQWHASAFGRDTHPKVSVVIMEQLRFFIAKTGSWAIVPGSVARWLCADGKIRVCRTAFEIPRRIVRCRALPGTMESAWAVKFLECLKEVVLARQAEGITFLSEA